MPPSSFAKKLTTGFFITLLLLLILTLVSLKTAWQSQRSNGRVNHTYDMIALTQRISEQFQDAQTNNAMYVISADTDNLRIFKKELHAVHWQIISLEMMEYDHPSQLYRVRQLDTCLSERFRILTKIAQIRSTDGYLAASQAINSYGLRMRSFIILSLTKRFSLANIN